MTLDEYSLCLDTATARMNAGYKINAHLRDGTVLADAKPTRAHGSLAVIQVHTAGGGSGGTDSYWWVPVADVLCLEVSGTLAQGDTL